VIIWLAVSSVGLIALAAGLVWLGWFADAERAVGFIVPQNLIPTLALPVVIAIFGYSRAAWRAWRRKPAVQAWLIGVSGHLVFTLSDAVLSGVGPAQLFMWDGIGIWFWLLVPGLMLLQIDRNMIENPPPS
jgi:hypothetical protein